MAHVRKLEPLPEDPLQEIMIHIARCTPTKRSILYCKELCRVMYRATSCHGKCLKVVQCKDGGGFTF
ncbi:hypothetical protein KSS87_004015 [Heliosperma pusillum]|nr:hypothetical protein KSS87_004015 [Heliosperma pusillum]